MFWGLAQLQDVNAHAHHFQRAELPLLFATSAQLGRLVEHQFAGNFLSFDLQVFHQTDNLTALVHVQQYGVAVVLFDIHSGCQDTRTIAVQALVADSYSFCLTHIIAF